MPSPDVDSDSVSTQHHCRKASHRFSGNELSRKRTNSFKMAMETKSKLNSTAKLNQMSSQEPQEIPLNMVIKDEILKKVNIKPHRNSPNVVARLMGLDSLPSQHSMPKQQKKKFDDPPQQISSVGSKKQKSCSKDHSFKQVSKELPNFKDVFEVMEPSEVENCKNHCIEKGSTNKENDYLSKNSVESKNLPTNERDDHCNGQSDVYEGTRVCVDNFPKLLPESSLFLNKSGKALVPRFLNKNGEILQKSKRKNVRKTQVQKKDRKHSGNYDYSSSSSYGFDETIIERKKETCSNTTRIVVLKPSLETIKAAKKIVSGKNSADNLLSGKRKPKEWCKTDGHNQKVSEVKDLHSSSDQVNVVRQTDNIGCGKTAKERIQNRICNWNDSLYMMNHGNKSDNEFNQTKSFSRRFEQYKGLTKVEAFAWNSKCSYDGLNGSNYHKSSANREVGKHRSRQRSISQRSEYVKRVGKHLDTLGDMLTLSEKLSPVHFLSKEIRHSWDEPSGISSRDGWKDICLKECVTEPINQTGSFGSEEEECFTLKDMLKLSSRRYLKEDLLVKKPSSLQIVDGVSGNSQLQNFRCEKIESSCTVENSHTDLWNSSVKFYDAVPFGDEFVVSDSDREVSSKFDTNKLHQLTPSPKEIRNDNSRFMNKTELTTIKGCSPNGSSKLSCDSYSNAVKSKHPSASNDLISKADIQAFRLQLGLKLRPESPDDNSKRTYPPQKLTNEASNSKDFCYVLDMLTLAGLNDTSILSFPAVNYNLHESPVGAEIFEKLEKLYEGQQYRWPRSERRLLFDITNSIICQYILPCGRHRRHPSTTDGQMLLFADVVWQLLVKKRREHQSGEFDNSLLLKNWICTANEIDIIGEAIENAIMGKLIDELLSKLSLPITR